MRSKLPAYTNVAYLGLWLAGWKPGIAGTILAIASFGYHWARANEYPHRITYTWQKLDEISMHLVFLTLIYLSIANGWNWIPFLAAWVYGIYKHEEFDNSYVGVLALLAIGCNEAWFSLWFYGAAMAFKWIEWNWDESHYWWAHSLWHILSAIAIYYTI